MTFLKFVRNDFGKIFIMIEINFELKRNWAPESYEAVAINQ